MSSCKHEDVKNEELYVKDIVTIFKINYRTALNWLGETVNEKYPNGKFPNAYKCTKCRKIIIPISDVKNLLKEI